MLPAVRFALRPLILNMTSSASMERIRENAELAKQTISELKNELKDLNITYNNIKAQQLREENAKLSQAVEEALKHLAQLEAKNGVTQISVPDRSTIRNAVTKSANDSPFTGTVSSKDTPLITEQTNQTPKEIVIKKADATASSEDPSKDKPKKEKKPKEAKEKAPAAPELPVDVGRLDLRIAKVEDVQRHPDADSLYVLKINCGEEKLRTVCSGLVKHVPIEELQNRLVMLLCNLKPAKMRGITSEAMVMCASTSERVEVLLPPATSVAGELVHCKGYERQPEAIMNPKKKIFETVAPDLHTNDALVACYKGEPFYVPDKGHILAKTLKNSPVK